MYNVNKYNIELGKACNEGDLEKVIFLTTDAKMDNLVEIDYDNNYPLKVACQNGHIEIVKFLLSHPNPQKLSLINTSPQITEAIASAINHNQCEIILFFKSNYPEQYAGYMGLENKELINDHFNYLSITGGIETVELLLSEIPGNMKLDIFAFLSQTLQHNHPKVFDRLISCTSIEAPSEEFIAYLLACALQFERFAQLKDIKNLIEKFDSNLSKAVTPLSFSRLIEKSPKSLNYIAQELDYVPSEELMIKIKDKLNQLPKEDSYYLNLKSFMDSLIAKEEKDKLKKHLLSSTKNVILKNKI